MDAVMHMELGVAHTLSWCPARVSREVGGTSITAEPQVAMDGFVLKALESHGVGVPHSRVTPIVETQAAMGGFPPNGRIAFMVEVLWKPRSFLYVVKYLKGVQESIRCLTEVESKFPDD